MTAAVSAVLFIVGVVAALAQGLGAVRQRHEGAHPGWLGIALVLELLSCLSYVLMFRPISCAQMQVRDIAVAYFVLKSAVNHEGRLCVRCAIPECPNLRPPGSGPGATHRVSPSAAYRSL